MSFVYDNALPFWSPDYARTADLRVILIQVGASSTAGTERATQFVAGFTTLGEHPDSTRPALPASTVSVNTPTLHEANLNFASDVTLNPVNVPQIEALVVYEHNTDDSDAKPCLYIDDGGFPSTPNGAAWTFDINDVSGLFSAVAL